MEAANLAAAHLHDPAEQKLGEAFRRHAAFQRKAAPQRKDGKRRFRRHGHRGLNQIAPLKTALAATDFALR